MNINDDIINLLKAIYQNTTFSFQHRGEDRTFPTRKGIRQGCKAAPTLWCCFAAQVLQDVSLHTSMDCVRECLTMYADDMVMHQHFTRLAELELFLTNVGHVLDILERCGMQLNMSKSEVMCRFLAPNSGKATKRFLRRTQEGVFLVIPRNNNKQTLLKVVADISYLGVKLSYKNTELLTQRLRVQSGQRAQGHLTKWLHCKTLLSQKLKIQLWFQCVFPCLTYGILHVGVTLSSLTIFYAECMKQLRRILKAPVFLSRDSHLDFLIKHSLPHPVVALQRLGQRLWDTATHQRVHLESQDILNAFQPDWYMHQLNTIQLFLHQQQPTSTISSQPSTNTNLHCDDCNLHFTTAAAYRRHCTQQHGLRSGQLRQCTQDDMIDGRPTCARCLQDFQTWATFKYHVEYVCLSERPAQATPTAHAEHHLRTAELVHYAATSNLQALGLNEALCAYFSQRCGLCAQICLTSRGLFHHWRTDHNQEFLNHGPQHQALVSPIDQT